MSETVFFYRLSRKFVERQQDVPDDARQVVYQALAIGHHVGVIDCLTVDLACPLDGYTAWVAKLPAGEARRKMEGVMRFGEIAIDASHAAMLGAALEAASPGWSDDEAKWAAKLGETLRAMEAEPALYLMVRQR